MKELINPRNFKIQKINLNELLNSDEDFRHYYDNGNVEDRYKHDEYPPSNNELEYELVIVDGILLDGYNRASVLLRNGETHTNGFVATPKNLKSLMNLVLTLFASSQKPALKAGCPQQV